MFVFFGNVIFPPEHLLQVRFCSHSCFSLRRAAACTSGPRSDTIFVKTESQKHQFRRQSSSWTCTSPLTKYKAQHLKNIFTFFYSSICLFVHFFKHLIYNQKNLTAFYKFCSNFLHICFTSVTSCKCLHICDDTI